MTKTPPPGMSIPQLTTELEKIAGSGAAKDFRLTLEAHKYAEAVRVYRQALHNEFQRAAALTYFGSVGSLGSAQQTCEQLNNDIARLCAQGHKCCTSLEQLEHSIRTSHKSFHAQDHAH
jgi:hypothetical protein